MIERQEADITSHHIEGYARAAIERGQSGHFRVPLISHIKGNLWVGGCIGRTQLPREFKYNLSLYPWEQYELPDGCSRIEVRLYDGPKVPDEPLLHGLAGLLADLVDAGQTLVNCQAGLNRSNLVAALMLIDVEGYAPKDAIELLREKRTSVVLCNETFENWLLEQR